MSKIYMQSIVQYAIDTETGKVDILKKFTAPIKGSQAMSYRKPKKSDGGVEKGDEVML